MTRSEAAKLRAKLYREKYGDDYFRKLGSKGGNKRDMDKIIATNKAKYGDDFYIKLAKMGRDARFNKRALRGKDDKSIR